MYELISDFGVFSAALNSMGQQIAIITANGKITWVNAAWIDFSEANGGDPDATYRKANFFEACNQGASAGDPDAQKVLNETLRIVEGELDYFVHEYPCNSPDEERYFQVRFGRLDWKGPARFLISYTDITERKNAEVRLEELVKRDSMTGVYNRGYMDEFLDAECRRASRLGYPVSVLLIDVDHFKAYNDNCGHLEGDACLMRIASALEGLGKRPTDLFARYGGEEFCLVLGNTGAADALAMAEQARQIIQDLAIEHVAASPDKVVTASIGVASTVPTPDRKMAPERLISRADKALYAAKDKGRNRVESCE